MLHLGEIAFELFNMSRFSDLFLINTVWDTAFGLVEIKINCGKDVSLNRNGFSRFG